MLALSTALALSLVPAAADAGPARYPRPDLLLEAGELARLIPSGKVRVLDCRGKGIYLDGHVPGAAWIGARTWAQAFDPNDTQDWTKRIGALGIDVDAMVVVYDDNRAKDAARIWWILRYWGIRDVRLLNGGWQAWRKSGGPIERPEYHPTPLVAHLAPQSGHFASKSYVLEHLQRDSQLVDARSAQEYCGTLETAKRNGAIPGATHLEWSDTVDPTGRFKSPKELTQLLRRAGIDPVRPTITYCQSGGRAAVMAFVLELMGGKDVRNYYRSWGEWGNAEDTPVSRPKK